MQPYPKLTKELMRLLPESRVDPTPLLKRRIGHEREMYIIFLDIIHIHYFLSIRETL